MKLILISHRGFGVCSGMRQVQGARVREASEGLRREGGSQGSARTSGGSHHCVPVSFQQHHTLYFPLHRGCLLRAIAPGRGRARALLNLDGICWWSVLCHLHAGTGFGYQVPTGIYP